MLDGESEIVKLGCAAEVTVSVTVVVWVSVPEVPVMVTVVPPIGGPLPGLTDDTTGPDDDDA